VENTAPARGPGEGWRVSQEPVLTMGRVTGKDFASGGWADETEVEQVRVYRLGKRP